MCAVPPDDSALILGGTRGLGLEIARALSPSYRSLAVGRRPPEGARVPEFIRADLTDPACAETVMAELKRRHGPGEWPSVFCWVAGNYHRGPFADQDPSKIAAMLSVHVTGPTSVLHAFHQEAKRRGVPYDLVVIGSVFVHQPARQHAMLSAVKGYKANFARVFWRELADDLPGSTTLLVNPWAMRTDFFEGYAMDPKAFEGFMDPAEVARHVAEHVYRPNEAKHPMVELTLDRDKANPGGTLELLGPQLVKY